MTHRNNAADIGRNILALNKCRRFARFGAAVLVGLVLTLAAAPACAQEPSPEWRPLIERLAAEGFDPGSLAALLGRGGVEYDPAAMTQKMEELYATKFGTRRTRSVQTHLARLGYLKDDVDGKLGPKTRHAIKLFQAAHGMAITGRADYALLDTLVRETRPMPPGTSVPEETDRQVVYSSVLTEERLAEARAFLAAHRATLHEVQSRYGVPAEI
ncbi:MAG: peptidoglycan-binding protein, partial [Oceanidesulfovibrio sp.]